MSVLLMHQSRESCLTLVLRCTKERIGISLTHRRRIELKDKAKVVMSVWGTESLPR